MRSFPIHSILAATTATLFGMYTPAIAQVAPRKSVDIKNNIASSPSTNQFHQLVDRAWRIIDENYAHPNFNKANWQQVRKEIQSRQYTSAEDAYTTIRAMLSKLNNPATRLLTPQQFASFEREDTSKPHVGVGLPEVLSLDIDEQTRQLKIVTPTPNTPAAEAGLLPGDRVLAVDGISTKGMDLGDAAMRVRGSEGSKVQLKIQRGNSKFDVALTRRKITPIPAVQATLETVWEGRKIGYIILNQFTASSPQELREALEGLQTADGFVLDLRNNPGGSVAALQEIAGFFLGEKVIGAAVKRTGATEVRSKGLQLTNKPLVVLVNQGTASAAEWLAGALLDSQRAAVVGTPTAGKGLIHSFLPLGDGAAIAVTAAQIETPSGREILGSGVTPNLRVNMAKSPFLDSTISFASWSDTQYRQAIEQLIMQTEGNSPVANVFFGTIASQGTD